LGRSSTGVGGDRSVDGGDEGLGGGGRPHEQREGGKREKERREREEEEEGAHRFKLRPITPTHLV
jgi:hypothetical protein